METNKKDFFWPSYVDLMTALFAVVLVLFILSYYNFTKTRVKLEESVHILREDSLLLANVKSNLKLFSTDNTLFLYDEKYKRVQIAFEIKFRTGFQYYNISQKDIESDYLKTTQNLDILGKKLESIILQFKNQKLTWIIRNKLTPSTGKNPE